MGQVCLISGPPGCGKTTWALQRLQQHQGPCAYLRLEGNKEAGLEQGADSGIDLAWLEDQVPKRSVIGIGGGRHYTLYDPATDHIEFRIAGEPSNATGRGFG